LEIAGLEIAGLEIAGLEIAKIPMVPHLRGPWPETCLTCLQHPRVEYTRAEKSTGVRFGPLLPQGSCVGRRNGKRASRALPEQGIAGVLIQ